jgi:hypothetical protein
MNRLRSEISDMASGKYSDPLEPGFAFTPLRGPSYVIGQENMDIKNHLSLNIIAITV